MKIDFVGGWGVGKGTEILLLMMCDGQKCHLYELSPVVMKIAFNKATIPPLAHSLTRQPPALAKAKIHCAISFLAVIHCNYKKIILLILSLKDTINVYFSTPLRGP